MVKHKVQGRRAQATQAAFKSRVRSSLVKSSPRQKKQNQGATLNSFTDSTGAYQFNPFGFPQNQSFPGSAPVEQVNTIFQNLRWYLVSNFRQVLSQCYVEIGLIQTLVDVPVDDAFRGGIDIKSKELDEEQINELQISIDRDQDLNKAKQAQKWNRLFGGAGVIVLVGDQDPETPLDLDAIGPDTELEFRAVDQWELTWSEQNSEGYDPSSMREETEFYNYYGEKLHKSRVMRLKGFEAPSFIRPRLSGWGFSVVEILVRSINQYLKATDLGFEVLDEFKIDVYKIKNLVNTLLSPNGAQKVRQRVQQANRDKNYLNALVMDSEDDWDHKQLSFAGLAETMTGIRMQVAADMRMPITKLFGTSASAGIGNTDQNDMENYNAMVESQVRDKSKYDILRMCEIKCQKLFGLIPKDLTVTFKPLRVLTAEQEENVKTQKFNRLLQARSAGEITTYEFREGCNKGNLFDVTLDNAGDLLNPDDPEVEEIVTEGSQDPDDPNDTDDPGSDRAETKKPKAKSEQGAPKGEMKPKTKDPAVQNEMARLRAYSLIQRMERVLSNSAQFDKASYEADGGDSWVSAERLKLLATLTPSNPGLWTQIQQESQELFGRIHLPFVVWLFKKRGGTLQ